MKRIVVIGLIFSLLFAFSGCAVRPETGEDPEITGILRVEDGYPVDENGERVLLRGVNLGNWLLMETWMGAVTNYADDWGYFDTLEVLESRFGAEKTAELVRAYEDHYITAEDIARIEALGFNCVRVPFWYRNFMHEDGTWLTDSLGDNPGIRRLDWVIGECRRHGIYVILDLHGAPGGQSMNHSTGKAGRNLLYTVGENMEAAERLWAALAERYRDEPAVAAYDLLNEPQNNGGGYGGMLAWPAESAEAVAHTNDAYDRLYRAVRAADENHMISFEGVWSTSVLPDPNEMGYENMLYQLHLYDTERGMIDYRVKELVTARKNYGAAVLVGEFNNQEQEAYACKKYAKNIIGFVKWTYKTVNTGGNWGLYNGNAGRIDVKTASFEEILEFFETKLDTADFKLNEAELECLMQ